jgi:signal transduction histidine kinase
MAGQGILTRTAPYRWALEPALGLVIALLWGSAAIAFGNGSSIPYLSLFSVAVALSRLLPSVSLAVGFVSMVFSSHALEGPLALTLLLVSGCVVIWGACLYGKSAVRYIALVAALVLGAVLTVLLLVDMSLSSGSSTEDLVSFGADLGVRLTLGLLSTAILVGGWVGALILRGRSDRRESGRAVDARPVDQIPPLTIETWLMMPKTAWLAGDVLVPKRTGFRQLSRSTLAIDVGVAVCFFLFCLLVDPPSSTPAFLVLVGFTAAVAMRRLSPALALAVAWLAATIQMLAGLTVLTSNFGVLIVLYATAAYAERAVRWVGLASAVLGALVAATYLSLAQLGVRSLATLTPAEITGTIWSGVAVLVGGVAVLGLSWTLGLLMRTWQTAREGRLSQNRAVEEQRAAQRSVVVEQERNRIARDMHDVVAHSLAVVIAQADGARYARANDPEAVDAALTTISTTARDALGDVRILLTRLRQDDAGGPQPVLADLDRLVDQMRSTGLDIEWTTTGSPTTLGSGAQLAVYRIVQEALTNALRHGDADRAVYLNLTWTDGWVAVTIDNAVSTDELNEHGGEIGHGLPGMRERALLAGGSLDAESTGGRFIVAARLPAITTSSLMRPTLDTTAGAGAQS